MNGCRLLTRPLGVNILHDCWFNGIHPQIDRKVSTLRVAVVHFGGWILAWNLCTSWAPNYLSLEMMQSKRKRVWNEVTSPSLGCYAMERSAGQLWYLSIQFSPLGQVIWCVAIISDDWLSLQLRIQTFRVSVFEDVAWIRRFRWMMVILSVKLLS